MKTKVAAGLFIGAFFAAFTWRGLLVYFTGDDVMNLYMYWSRPVSDLIKANAFFWTPYYRPFGGIIYRALFALFGFNPRPLYLVYYASLLVNLYVAYLVLRRIGGSREIGALGTLIWSVHGELDYLYYNAGSMYDVYCFLFFFVALLVYVRERERGGFLSGWNLAAFLASFICCLNSKEMGAALPAVLLVYELLFHTPRWRGLSDFGRWVIQEGRGALIAGACVIGYIPAKLSQQGLLNSPAYTPHFTGATYLHDTAVYLGYLTYRSHAFIGTGMAVFYTLLAAGALVLRSRAMWFGLLFFQITLLPVSFVSAREGFVLYLPLAGLALYLAVLLVSLKDKLLGSAPKLRASGSFGAACLLMLTAGGLGTLHAKHWRAAEVSGRSGIRITKEQLLKMYPTLERGSRLLFANTLLDDGNWDLVFTLRLVYQDKSLFITQMQGPPEQRIPLERLGHYDHIFTYAGDRYVELDNADTQRSLRLSLVKEGSPGEHIGETMTIASPDAYKYFVKDVVMWNPQSDACWTLEAPELKFWLVSSEHRFLAARFRLVKQTLAQTGPLVVDYFVNDRLLDRVRYADEGEHTYRREVPAAWLRTGDYTLVRMQVENPYIAPADGAKLGVLLMSTGFGAGAAR